jgi:hypothetical protein
MVKKLGLATITATVLLTGCGGGSNAGDKATPNTIEAAQQKLIGTWIYGTYPNGCDNTGGSPSYKTIYNFTQSDLIVEDFEYNNTTCDTSGLTSDIAQTLEYVIEGTDKANTGQISYKTSFTITKEEVKKGSKSYGEESSIGQVIKTEFLFDNDHLVFSEKEKTPNQYTNDFNLSDFFIKQP